MDKLYTALQLLAEQREVTREAIDDVAVWASQELGGDFVDRERSPHDVLRDALRACVDRSTAAARNKKGADLVAFLTSPEVATALRVELVECGFAAKAFAAFAARPQGPLRELALKKSRIGAEALAKVLAAPVVRSVERLAVGGNTFGDDGGDLLAATENLPGLRALECGYVKMTLPGVERLVAGPALRELRSWQNSTDKFGAELGTVLARGPSLANLQGIRMYGSTLGNSGLANLVRDPVFRLRRLTASECGIGESGMAALAAAPAMADLEELRLRYDPMTDKALAALCASKHVRKLARLQISQCRIGGDGAAALAASGLPIEELDLSTNRRLGPHALQLFGALSNLRHLDLGGYKGGDADVAAFAAHDYFPKLETLALENNDLTDAAIVALVRWPHFGKLRELRIGTNSITDAAIELIARTPNRLEVVEVWQTAVTQPFLASALPNVRGVHAMEYEQSPWA